MAELEGVFFTYRDVAEANPTWTDRMVEDYLASKRNTDNIQEQIDAIILRLITIELRLDLIEARLDYLEGSIVVTAIDVSVTGNTTVICTGALTVTLDDTPNDRDVVTVKRTAGKVTIDGNGNDIDLGATLNISRKGDAPKLIFSESQSTWYVI